MLQPGTEFGTEHLEGDWLWKERQQLGHQPCLMYGSIWWMKIIVFQAVLCHKSLPWSYFDQWNVLPHRALLILASRDNAMSNSFRAPHLPSSPSALLPAISHPRLNPSCCLLSLQSFPTAKILEIQGLQELEWTNQVRCLCCTWAGKTQHLYLTVLLAGDWCLITPGRALFCLQTQQHLKSYREKK